jgi:fructose-bisphosphate aldolase, class II
MPLCNLQKVLAKAEKEKYGVGNFDVFNLEMLKGVLDAAEETRSPIILAYGEAFEALGPIESFAPAMVRLAEKATVPVVVHLDHSVNLEFILRAVHNGFTSVMIDASDKTIEENIEITKRVVEICRVFGISVEAELGHVSGLKGLYQNDDYIYTNVEEAKVFTAETGIDALAVAIGTVHGVYKEEPRLNLERLKEIRKAVKQFLVLHGGSGLSDEDFKNTIKYGITKVNIFTDLTLAAMDCIHKNSADIKLSYISQCVKIAEAVKLEAIKKMEIFGCCGKAD